VIGILSYGAYVPPTRLPLSALGHRTPREDGPEKAIAGHDEDAITLGVTAAIHALSGLDRSTVDMLVFASTTLPYQEKSAASLVAHVLDLRHDVRTTDVAGSTRAGTSALALALDAVRAGSARRVLVVASDVRLAAPGSPLEAKLGDAAAALLIGDGDAIATVEDFAALSDEVTDLWRTTGERFVHTWEDRFVVQESFLPSVSRAVQTLLERSGSSIGDYGRVALTAPDARTQMELARRLAIPPDALAASFFGELGHAGAAFAPLLLIGVLEQAAPGERILLANFGDGADAIALRTTDAIQKLEPRRDVRWSLARRRVVPRYADYVGAHGLGATEWPAAAGPGLSATILRRERDDDLAFLGRRCRGCRNVQFPAQRVCESCHAKDDFEPVRLSDRVGRIVTYTLDYFYPTPSPPTVVAVVDVEGARIHLQIVELPADEVELGGEVEFVFRRMHETGGRPNYYWKGIPRPSSR
jgi:3-hydroxy-3-methylglutaryl CoA synthase/uncharacterized OB-fold protein